VLGFGVHNRVGSKKNNTLIIRINLWYRQRETKLVLGIQV